MFEPPSFENNDLSVDSWLDEFVRPIKKEFKANNSWLNHQH